jgi:hypothetical protein
MANVPELLAEIPGASDLFAWFGFWPTFHDGEVLSLHLDRAGPSRVRVHTWERTNELDSRRHYVLRKHVVVAFILEDISDLELDRFSCQNVVSSMTLARDPNGFELELWPCYGLSGKIKARSVRIELEPGMPPK